jgi:hypothetical protein
MPTNTYEPIATYTATGSQSTITFSSIPQTYKHLVFSGKIKGSVNNEDLQVRFNGSSGNSSYAFAMSNENVSNTTSVSHYAITDVSYVRFGDYIQSTAQSSDWSGIQAQIYDYTSTNHYKTYSSHSMNAVLGNQRMTGFFVSNSAITQLDFLLGGAGNFVSGSTFTLYGLVG